MIKQLLLSLALVATALSQHPLGTFTLGASTTNSCPTGAACWNFTVAAPGILNAGGELAVRNPAGQIKAVDVFFSWDTGSGYWGGTPNPTPSANANFFNNLLNAGHQLILVKWNGNWYNQAPAAKLGPLAAAVRPATVIQWINDNYPASSFNVIGTSNGAAAVAYALADYGITMNLAIVDSGPPEMAITKGCEHYTGYEFTTGNGKAIIDQMFGYNSNGPCVQEDASFESQWDDNSVESNGDFYYEGVSVHIISGTADNDFIRNRSADYRDLLLSWGQDATLHPVVGMGHGAMGNQAGLDTIFKILSAAVPTPTPTVPPVPTPTATCFCP